MEALFSSVQPTENSLSTTSVSLLSRYTPNDVAATWNTGFDKSPSEHKLTMIYLANEILQTSRKSHGAAFTSALTPSVLRAIPLLSKARPEYIPKLKRVIDVWEQRKILSKEDIALARGGIVTSPSPSTSPRAATGNIGKRPRQQSISGQQQSPPIIDDVDFDPLLMDPHVLIQASSSSQISNTKSSLLLQVIASLTFPNVYKKTFDEIELADREGVSEVLAAEKINRELGNLYKAVKSLALEHEALRAVTESLSVLSPCQALDKEDAIARSIGPDDELYDAVPVDEEISVSLPQIENALILSKPRMETMMHRREDIIGGLTTILEECADLHQVPPETSSCKDTLQRLENSEGLLNELSKVVTAKIDAETEKSLKWKTEQLLAQVPLSASQAPAWNGPPQWGGAVGQWGPPHQNGSVPVSAAAAGRWKQQQPQPQQWVGGGAPPAWYPQQHWNQQHQQYPPPVPQNWGVVAGGPPTLLPPPRPQQQVWPQQQQWTTSQQPVRPPPPSAPQTSHWSGPNR